jgi:hypothetical protein
LERSVVVGSPAVQPPNPDDESDQLLCDILDVIDKHPDLKGHGSYYGADRHLANLQALGVWRGTDPISRPSPRELFATTFSNLTSDAVTISPSPDGNCSPAPEDFCSGGELFGPADAPVLPTTESFPSPQTIDGVVVMTIAPDAPVSLQASEPAGIIRHATQNPGEQIDDSSSPPLPLSQSPPLPHRPVRRGRPLKLDDLAKGRLLGLMSYGLSFRQAAAQLGVHHQTLLNAMKRDEEFAQQVSEARLDAISQPLLTVVQASRTSWRAAAWLAKFLDDRRSRSYETTPEEHELARLRT